MFRRRLPPFLMFNGPEATGSSSPPAAPAAVPAEPAPPAAPVAALPPAAPVVPEAPAAPVAAADPVAAPPMPGVPAEVEAELRQLRADFATLSGQAAETLQLRYANDHGITKAERVLLTATTAEALADQVAAVLAMRAPSTASAKDAGITGGASSGVTKRAGSLAEAVAARVNKN